MLSHNRNANTDKKQQFLIHDESLESTGNSRVSDDLFQTQVMRDEAPEKLDASTPTTPMKTSSAEQEYPSPPQSTVTTKSSVLPKKRAADDELLSSPIKKFTIRPPRRRIAATSHHGHARDQLLQNQMTAKIKLNETKKKDPSAGTLKHLTKVDPLRPLNCKIDSQRLWDEESLNLGQYPRLVTTKLTYRYHQLKNSWNDAWEYVCFPIAPADDIEKSLQLGSASKKVKWTGPWAEQKLQKEIAKYDTIKEFWLFNYSPSSVIPFFPGLDKKEEFCVGLFSEELQSPWVRTWLREFLGGEVMGEIEAAMKSVDEERWRQDSDNVLHHQRKWESLRLRFKRDGSLE